MTLPLLKTCFGVKTVSLMSALLLATTAYAEPKLSTNNTIKTSITQRANMLPNVSSAIDNRLRQVLTQAGIKTSITAITVSEFPNMYKVSLVDQPPLHMTADGGYVIQAELQKNPNPSRKILNPTPTQVDSASIGKPINPNAQMLLYYTAIPGVLWGASSEGIPFLLSADAQYITDSEISVIQDGSFMGLDQNFETRKNKLVLSSLDATQLIVYPATTTERAVIYVATDVNCPYCRRLHQQLPMLNAKGITVKAIGYPIYEQSFEPMRAIWCLGDKDRRRDAFDKAMLQGEMPAATTSCETSAISPNRRKAAYLGNMTTPAIYREDGVFYQASFESPEFLEFLGIE